MPVKTTPAGKTAFFEISFPRLTALHSPTPSAHAAASNAYQPPQPHPATAAPEDTRRPRRTDGADGRTAALPSLPPAPAPAPTPATRPRAAPARPYIALVELGEPRLAVVVEDEDSFDHGGGGAGGAAAAGGGGGRRARCAAPLPLPLLLPALPPLALGAAAAGHAHHVASDPRPLATERLLPHVTRPSPSPDGKAASRKGQNAWPSGLTWRHFRRSGTSNGGSGGAAARLASDQGPERGRGGSPGSRSCSCSGGC